MLFLVALVGQAFAGQAEFNNQQRAAGLPTSTLWDYLLSADYAVDVTENWQCEYLQFLLYIVVTVWLVQKGSPESKSLNTQGRETDEQQRLGQHVTSGTPRWAVGGGLRSRLYSRSATP